MDQMVRPASVGRQENREPREGDPLRLWLRLFATANLVEAELARRLRAEFGTTLPRFDLMAQLAKADAPLALGEISRRLMVTNGNVTGLVDRLVEDGLVERRTAPDDRRSSVVSFTPAGRERFDEMAKAHRGWVSELFGGLGEAERADLSTLLSAARRSVQDNS